VLVSVLVVVLVIIGGAMVLFYSKMSKSGQNEMKSKK
jgi:hypothetical protein